MTGSRTRRALTHLAVLLGYAATSYAFLGVRITSHPGRGIVGSGQDSQIFVWSFGWWAHALSTWQNPFFTHAIYAPGGINLAWTSSAPGLALVFVPLTLLVGPTAAYNVAALLMPALAAWTAYFLCLHVTRRVWPAIVGGYVFGFSSYMVAVDLGHLHLAAVFLLPLSALVLVRFVEGSLSGVGLAWRLGVLLGAEFWLSTEVLFTLTLVLLVALPLAYWLVRPARPRLRALPVPLLGAYGIGALVTGPLGVYALLDVQTGQLNEPTRFSADVLNFVIPTRLIGAGGGALTGISGRFPATIAEQGAYLGWPVLVIVGWFAWRERHSGVARFLLAGLVAAMLLELGTALWVDGHRELWLPWKEVSRLPLFDSVLPSRFAVYAALACSAIVALWMRSSSRAVAVVLPLLAVVALAPAVWRIAYRDLPERWQFFTAGEYKCLPKNENVAIFPFGVQGNSMLWQAESGFWFRMADGYIRPMPPAAALRDPTIYYMYSTELDPTPAQILAMAKDERIGRILSVDVYAHPNGTEMHAFGALQVEGGLLVAPACGHPPLTPQPRG
jgi:hypothetical protein